MKTINGLDRIVYKNRTYYRRKNSTYYSAVRPSKMLHAAIWEDFHGKKIPKNHEIHHIDHDPFNNSIENLECLSASNHLKKHWAEKKQSEKSCVVCNKKYLCWFPGESRFCSMRCYQRNLRKSGAYNETRQCVICQSDFSVDRYVKTKCCSRSCGSKFRLRNQSQNQGSGGYDED